MMLTVLKKSMLDGMIYMGRGLLIINAEMIIEGNISFGDLRIKNGLILFLLSCGYCFAMNSNFNGGTNKGGRSDEYRTK